MLLVSKHTSFKNLELIYTDNLLNKIRILSYVK